jgi:hypothetical protein
MSTPHTYTSTRSGVTPASDLIDRAHLLGLAASTETDPQKRAEMLSDAAGMVDRACDLILCTMTHLQQSSEATK